MNKLNKFNKDIAPYLRVVSEDFAQAMDPKVSDSIRESFSRYSGNLSLQEYFERAIVSRRIFSARMLRFLDVSWAPYDKISDIEGFLHPSFFGASPSKYSLAFCAVNVLEKWKLIEVQYNRARITEYGKEVCRQARQDVSEADLE